MPTPVGWMLLGLGIVSAAAGRVFALIELYVVSITAVAALAVAVAVRLAHRSQLSVSRHVTPTMVAVGKSVEVHLTLLNRSRLVSSAVLAAEPVNASEAERIARLRAPIREFRFSFAPLPGGAQASCSYRLHLNQRGIAEIGPTELTEIDGLGLAQRRRRVGSVSPVIVHPPLHQLLAPKLPIGGDLSLPAEVRRRSSGLASEEFDVLRPYANGDDLRHIHWRSTARFDDLMVRKFQPARPGRLTVLIDTRPPGDLPAAQDLTTSVAASIVCAVLNNSDEARIVASDGRATVVLASNDASTALEFLALLHGGQPNFETDGLGLNTRQQHTSMLVVVTARPEISRNESARRSLAQRFGAWLVISCGDAQRDQEQLAASPSLARSAPTVDRETGWIHLTSAGQLPALWHEFLTGAASTAAPERQPADTGP